MFEQSIKMPYVTRRFQKLSKYKFLLDKCSEYLIQNRYSDVSIGHYRRALEHFLLWIQREKLRSKLNEALIKEFISEHLPNCQCTTPCPRRIMDLRPALNLLLRVQESEFPNKKSRLTPMSKIDVVINEFNEYLVHVCGLSDRTCIYHRRHLRILLTSFFKKGRVRLNYLNPTNIRNFLYDNLQHYKRRSLGVFIYSLRTFFKFLQFKGIGNTYLIASLPKIIEWKSAALPEYLNKQEVDQLFNVINRNQALGKRDYAMITCMLELGLRACEVANLKLKDINWRNKILYLPRGKTRQFQSLPMTQLVIDSIVAYLKSGRPQTTSHQVFVYHRAPVGKGIIPKVVTEVVRRAFVRAGLKPIISGAHILRRTFATNLLQNGATIKEIADLLRHRTINITSIYIKVDLVNLSQVALPWPEEVL